MRCTEEHKHPAGPAPSGDAGHEAQRRIALGLLSGVAAWLAGCAAKPPAPVAAPAPAPVVPPPVAPPAPAPVFQPPPAPAPAPMAPPLRRPEVVVNLGPKVDLPPAPAVRSWDEFRKMAARRMVAASPKGSYMSKPQPMLFGIPILEIDLNADGSIRDIAVTRPPANVDAQDTIDHAIEAIRRAAPFGDISRLPRPWRFTEVFLFNNKRQFKPRSLD